MSVLHRSLLYGSHQRETMGQRSFTSVATTPMAMAIIQPRRIVRRSSSSFRYGLVASFSSISPVLELRQYFSLLFRHALLLQAFHKGMSVKADRIHVFLRMPLRGRVASCWPLYQRRGIFLKSKKGGSEPSENFRPRECGPTSTPAEALQHVAARLTRRESSEEKRRKPEDGRTDRAVRVKQSGLSWTVRKKQIGKQRKSPDNHTDRDPQMAKQPDLQFGYISFR